MITSTPPSIDPEVVAALAPTGRLRASINLGNPLLANRDPQTGQPGGVSVDLARELGRWLGVEVDLVALERAAASVETVKGEQADVGFFAIDPARSDGLLFTAAYVLIEGSYLVLDSSPIIANDDVDRSGRQISVGTGTAYDLFLTRELTAAELVRLNGARAAMDAVRTSEVEVVAGIRQVLEAEVSRESGVRVLPGRFMVIQQAMGIPASRGSEAQAVVAGFVEQMKAGGFVADALARHGVEGGSVAPPA